MKELIKKIYTDCTDARAEEFALFFESFMFQYNIENIHRKRAFFAQIGHESGQLKYTEENLNYSAKALRSVFGKYFNTDADAQAFARQPEKIANRVYANRIGNGEESSGDGWRFRGRGLIQITGRANYEKISELTGEDFVSYPEKLSEPGTAVLSAVVWWCDAGLNELADKLGGADDLEVFKKITKCINGGYNGLDDRLDIYERTKAYIK
ncbi:MAG: glycoside hydrolase family 19 protein [Lachnospirales bacterium]